MCTCDKGVLQTQYQISTLLLLLLLLGGDILIVIGLLLIAIDCYILDGAFGKPWDELRPYRVGSPLRNSVKALWIETPKTSRPQISEPV